MSKIEEINDEELDKVTGGVQVNTAQSVGLSQGVNTSQSVGLAQGLNTSESVGLSQGVNSSEAFTIGESAGVGPKPFGSSSTSPFTQQLPWYKRIFSWWPFK